MGVVLTVAERAKINRKVRLGTRCVAVGRSGEVPLLEVLNNGKYNMEDIPFHQYQKLRDMTKGVR